jgi:hypothetical protein
VLARVLLDVVEAAIPVHAAAHERADRGRVALDDVDDGGVFRLDAIDDAGRAERAGVVRLAAAGRVEGRAVEDDGDATRRELARGEDGRVEVEQVRVGVVETFGRAHAGEASRAPRRASSGAVFDSRAPAR